MDSKSEIISNLREYSSDQIADAIMAGTITMYELSKSGNLTPLMRRRVEQKIEEKNSPSKQSVPNEAMKFVSDEASNERIQESLDENIETESYAEESTQSDSIVIERQIVTNTAPSSFDDEPDDNKTISSSDAVDNKGVFKRPFSFHGRIRRTEFGITFIIYFVWYYVFSAIFKATYSNEVAFVFVMSFIPMMWFLWAQGCKRCHDRGNSGWYQLIPFYFLVLLFAEGDNGDNEYGNNPK